MKGICRELKDLGILKYLAGDLDEDELIIREETALRSLELLAPFLPEQEVQKMRLDIQLFKQNIRESADEYMKLRTKLENE